MAALVDGVFLPLLGSTANNANWPKVVSEDVVNQANGLKSSTQVTVGQIKGQTLLPLPTGSDSVLSEHIDKGLVHAVETAVIEWYKSEIFNLVKFTNLLDISMLLSIFELACSGLKFFVRYIPQGAPSFRCSQERLRPTIIGRAKPRSFGRIGFLDREKGQPDCHDGPAE